MPAFVNPSKPSGLNPVRYLKGAKYDGKFQIYSIAAANTNPFYMGDLVTPVLATDASGIPGITLATAGNVALGVIIAVGTQQYGAYVNPNALQNNFRPSGAQTQVYYAAVSDDPDIIYEIQEGGAGTNLSASLLHHNANIIYAAPAAGVVVSGTQLDNGSLATTSTLNLKIMRLVPRIDNHFVTSPTTGGGAQKWWVMINNHYFRSGITAL